MLKKVMIAAIAMLGVQNSVAETLRISADVWYPATAAENGENPGYLIEIAREIFKEANIDVVYTVKPWERALVSAHERQENCVAGAFISDAPGFLFPKNPQGLDSTSFFVKKGNPWRYKGSLEALKEVKVATIGGYSYDGGPLDAYVEANEKTGKVQSVNAVDALDQNIKKVLAGRVDVVVESDAVFAAKIATLGIADQFESAGRFSELKDLYIACAPEDPANKKYTNLLSDGMVTLKKNGKLKEILIRYGLSFSKELEAKF